MFVVAKLTAKELEYIEKATQILYEMQKRNIHIDDLEQTIECLEEVYRQGR